MVSTSTFIVAFIAISFQECLGFKLNPPTFPPDYLDPVKEKVNCFNKYHQTCDPNAKYRSYDGSCNNLIFTALGKAHTTFKRMFPDTYKDSSSSIVTKSPNGTPLPNARTITQTVFVTSGQRSTCQPDPFWPMMMISFCQFLTHDMASTVLALGHNGKTLDCPCDPKKHNSNCMSLPISDSRFPDRCMKMPRAASANEILKCTFEKRQSVNSQSSYLDLSQTYGVSIAENRALRTLKGGQMLTSPGVAPDCAYLPRQRHGGAIKFVTGDDRANENLGLTALHTLFLREHNRLAKGLAKIHPDWCDEKLFQEARRINIAQYQHAIYNELLPIMIGSDFMANFSINEITGYSKTYNEKVNSSVSVEFAAAAFRLGHALNAQLYCFTDSSNRSTCNNIVTFPSIVENTRIAFDHSPLGIEAIMNGLLTPAMSKFGNCFADGMMNCLFNNDAQPCIDLPATNMMRGLDLGLPFYKTVRDILDLYITPAKDITDIMMPSVISDMLNLHKNDLSGIGLFEGGITELVRDPSPRPVLACTTFGSIIGKQFQDLRHGDRYFFDNPPSVNPGFFTPEQLQSIRGQTLSKLICLNFNTIQKVLRNTLVLSRISGEILCDQQAMALNLTIF